MTNVAFAQLQGLMFARDIVEVHEHYCEDSACAGAIRAIDQLMIAIASADTGIPMDLETVLKEMNT